MMLDRIAGPGGLAISVIGFIAQEISELPELIDPAVRYGSPLALLWGAIHLIRYTYRSATETAQASSKEAHDRADQWAQELVANANASEERMRDVMAEREQEWSAERATLLAQLDEQRRHQS